MIRHVRLTRTKPLTATTGLHRTGWLRSGGPINPVCRRHTATGRPVERPTAEQWGALRGLLWARCGGFCEACDAKLNPLLWDAHHRLPRSHGGTDTLPALVALHPGCHTVQPWSVHMRPACAYDRGLLVHSGADPARTPLTLPDGRRVLLTAGGSYEVIP